MSKTAVIHKKRIKHKIQISGANAVEYALVMAIVVGMMIMASQALRPGVDGMFSDTGQKMVALVNGGAGSGQELSTNGNQTNANTDDGGGSFLGSLWNGTKTVVGTGGSVLWGAGEGLYDTGAGIVTLGYDVVRLPFNGEVRGKYADAGRAIYNDPSLIVDALVDPITDDWENGNRGEAVGRGIFEVLSMVVAPTKIAKLGKVDDVARVADNLGELGDVGRLGDDAAAIAARTSRITPDNAFDMIDEFRRLKGNMSQLGDDIPIRGDGNGTVSFVDIDGNPVFGVNSTNLARDIDKNLGRDWASTLDLQYGRGTGQFLTHAEAHSLMRAYDKTGGNLPANMSMYVDRASCSFCRAPDALPRMAREMGVENLTLHFKDGRTGIIRNGAFEWQ